ncbi:hypothetical protein LWT90_22895, partial [Enterobacter hormaechei]|nr:hypothetical protein [Enterobacter hormaechei]
HVIVEEWVDAPTDVAAGAMATVFPFSASDDEQLGVVLARFRDWLAPRLAELDTPTGRARVAATLQLGRTPLRARARVVAASLADLLQALSTGDLQRG